MPCSSSRFQDTPRRASDEALLPAAARRRIAQLLAPRARPGLVRGDDPEACGLLRGRSCQIKSAPSRGRPRYVVRMLTAATTPTVGRLARALVDDGRAGANVLTACLRALTGGDGARRRRGSPRRQPSRSSRLAGCATRARAARPSRSLPFGDGTLTDRREPPSRARAAAGRGARGCECIRARASARRSCGICGTGAACSCARSARRCYARSRDDRRCASAPPARRARRRHDASASTRPIRAA